MISKEKLVTMILSDNEQERRQLYDALINSISARNNIAIHKHKVKSVKKIRRAENEYVYDIGMRNEAKPWYFGNNILIHNSCYFSAYPMLKNQINNSELVWSKEMCIELYDNIAEQANESFPAFMERAFHTTRKNGEVIKAGRELIGDRALFITKKRYAINIFDKEGKRKDIGNKSGEVKAMGLDLKRADTPKYVQEFLMEILTMVLSGAQREEILAKIREFKVYLSQQPSWNKGSPKSVNNLTYYGDLEANSKKGRENMPGHVRAALNYNYLRRMNGDNYSQRIVDGMKVIVCKLRPNSLGFTSIAYPTDELRLPQWFCDLAFDDEAMENTLVDDKIDNLIGVLNWNVETELNIKSTFGELFSFG